ncbi:hypothetical protein, partial [Clostridium botulinum]|uniref:hypothetical protein n=1 Tax=Clostridium botulinum TaxID=1491 RepID=UPI0009D55448
MIKKRKILNVLSKAAIGAIISASFSITAYASVDGILSKNSNNQYYFYGYDKLLTACEDKAIGLKSKLFDDYMSKQVVAIHDDKNGFIDYKVVEKAVEYALVSEEEFNLDNFIKDSSDKVEISSEVTSVCVNEDGAMFTKKYDIKNNIVEKIKDEVSKGENPETIVNNEKNVKIQSNLIQSYVREERSRFQNGYLVFKFKTKGQDRLQNTQTIRILDKTIELNADDNSGKI